MARLHAEWSSKIADVMIPYLAEFGSNPDINLDKIEKNKALFQVSNLLQEWALSQKEKGFITFDSKKCNRTYTRFRTRFMDQVIPDAPNTKSIWNSPNHYFYEIVNKTGNSVFLQLTISLKGMPKDQIETSERINEHYPSVLAKPNEEYRIPFMTGTFNFANMNDKKDIFGKLDEGLHAILQFEEDLKHRLNL